jgi:PAS domain S-box-containing protein
MDKRIKILHLEDLQSDAELVDRTLVKGGVLFEKHVVDNREDFIRELETFHPDIILSDHSLPSFDSQEALRIVKEKSIKVPFILITATISEEFAVDIMKFGAFDYILKDRMQRLPKSILNALEKHALEIERDHNIQKIIENEALLKEAEQLASIGSWQTDLTNADIKWSDELYRIYGYEPGEITPSFKTFIDHVHPDDQAFVSGKLEVAMNVNDFEGLDFRVLDKHQQLKYIRSVIAIKRNQDGQPSFLTGFNQDITEMRLAIESLKNSEANFRTILENANRAYILIDTDLKIITFNNLAGELAKKDLGSELREKSYGIEHFPLERRPILEKMLKAALAGIDSQYEVNYGQKDGTFDWYDANIHGIRNNEGKVLGLIMSLTDISERKKMELQREKISKDLIQRNKDLEQFAYIVSHNLRAPVANIIGFSQLLDDGLVDDVAIQHCVKGISTAAQKLDEVVHDLNHVLQIKREINEQKGLVKFSDLVEDIKLSIESLLNNEQVEISYDFDEVSQMQTIKSYLHSIFYNLISNSIKYKKTDEKPMIRISSAKDQEKLYLIFEDNGIGIDMQANKGLIFGLYKRFHNHVEGKGMGLFMTKTQVEALGGKISVLSEEGKGTIFKIEFSL